MSETIYELTELKGDDVIAGNYIQPASFRIPDFCEGCPLAENICKPRISRVREALHPVDEGGLRHVGPFRDYVASVLVLSDEENSAFEPVYLGEEPLVSPFSVQHESPDSQVLSRVQRAVDGCAEPLTKKRIFRPEVEVCASGLTRVKDYRRMGQRLIVNPESLEEASVVVDSETPDHMARLIESAHAREAAGRPLKDLCGTEESLKAMESLHRATMLLTPFQE